MKEILFLLVCFSAAVPAFAQDVNPDKVLEKPLPAMGGGKKSG